MVAFFLNLNVQRPDFIKKLADGLVLLHSQQVMRVSERIPRMSEEEFLIAGEAAAEALAREGKSHLYMKDVARQMRKDRETVKVLRKTYPNVWPKLVRKFTDTHTWLSAHKRT